MYHVKIAKNQKQRGNLEGSWRGNKDRLHKETSRRIVVDISRNSASEKTKE